MSTMENKHDRTKRWHPFFLLFCPFPAWRMSTRVILALLTMCLVQTLHANWTDISTGRPQLSNSSHCTHSSRKLPFSPPVQIQNRHLRSVPGGGHPRVEGTSPFPFAWLRALIIPFPSCSFPGPWSFVRSVCSNHWSVGWRSDCWKDWRERFLLSAPSHCMATFKKPPIDGFSMSRKLSSLFPQVPF